MIAIAIALTVAAIAGAALRAESMPEDPPDWQPRDAWRFGSKEYLK